VLIGLLVGGMMVNLFAALAIESVGRAGGAVVEEVRQQFRDNPGIMEGTVRPEYGRVVDICTRDSLRELATPGLLAILAPIAVGFGLGVGPLAGYLVGAIACGVLMAIFLANSGGAWDNGKKLVEDGHHGGKGSPAHAATVVGDTVGDPFKDTTSVALNPIIKFSTLFGLLAVEIAVGQKLSSAAHHTTNYIPFVGVVMLVIALVFVWRSFYAMRIPAKA
jgi:K(+)-stimulated pyrophosphate-energized sodium pump